MLKENQNMETTAENLGMDTRFVRELRDAASRSPVRFAVGATINLTGAVAMLLCLYSL